MLSHLRTRLPQRLGKGALVPSIVAQLQIRFVSKRAIPGVSSGRTMPVHLSRATAPVKDLDAVFTIRVR